MLLVVGVTANGGTEHTATVAWKPIERNFFLVIVPRDFIFKRFDVDGRLDVEVLLRTDAGNAFDNRILVEQDALFFQSLGCECLFLILDDVDRSIEVRHGGKDFVVDLEEDIFGISILLALLDELLIGIAVIQGVHLLADVR